MHFNTLPIITDFNRFVDYISEAENMELTKTSTNLRAVDLLMLNERMQQPILVPSSKPKQKDFVLLSAFYFIGLAAELWLIRRNAKGIPCLMPYPERISIYDRMTNDERYGFLLQAYWCYFDQEAAFDDRSAMQDPFFFKTIPSLSVGKPSTKGTDWAPMRQAVILSALGMFDFSTEAIEKQSSRYAHIKTVTLNEVGQKLLPILGSEEFSPLNIDRNPKLTNELYQRVYSNADGSAAQLPDFFAPFKSAYPDWKIETRLFPIVPTVVTGIFTFKISLSPKCYRIITMRSEATFEDLHIAIQDIFNFDNDHLYVFYLNGQSRTKVGYTFNDPRGDSDFDEYPADLFALGEVGLYQGQWIQYIFDFGDHWAFNVEVINVESSDKKIKGGHQLVQSVGKAPRQYQYE